MEFFVGKKSFENIYLFYPAEGEKIKYITRTKHIGTASNHPIEDLLRRKPTLREIFIFKNSPLFEEVLKDYINGLD